MSALTQRQCTCASTSSSATDRSAVSVQRQRLLIAALFQDGAGEHGAVRVSCGLLFEADLWTCLDQQHLRLTMDKHLLGLIWGLHASFALPSVAACRRAFACMRTLAAATAAPGVERRRHPRPAAAEPY